MFIKENKILRDTSDMGFQGSLNSNSQIEEPYA